MCSPGSINLCRLTWNRLPQKCSLFEKFTITSHKGGDLLGKWDITGTSTEEQRALPSGWEREGMELKKKAASDGSGLTNSPGFCGQNRVA